MFCLFNFITLSFVGVLCISHQTLIILILAFCTKKIFGFQLSSYQRSTLSASGWKRAKFGASTEWGRSKVLFDNFFLWNICLEILYRYFSFEDKFCPDRFGIAGSCYSFRIITDCPIILNIISRLLFQLWLFYYLLVL